MDAATILLHATVTESRLMVIEYVRYEDVDLTINNYADSIFVLSIWLFCLHICNHGCDTFHSTS